MRPGPATQAALPVKRHRFLAAQGGESHVSKPRPRRSTRLFTYSAKVNPAVTP